MQVESNTTVYAEFLKKPFIIKVNLFIILNLAPDVIQVTITPLAPYPAVFSIHLKIAKIFRKHTRPKHTRGGRF